MSVTIYHNPACSTSRNVLAAIRAAGIAPDVIEYLKAGWKRPQLVALFKAAGLTPRAALRTNNAKAVDLGLTQPDISDAAILDAMVAHPELVQRPIVSTPKGTLLCRPADLVAGLLNKS